MSEESEPPSELPPPAEPAGGAGLAFAPGCLLLAAIPVFMIIIIFSGLGGSTNCDPSQHTCSDPPDALVLGSFGGLAVAAVAAFLAARWRVDDPARSRRWVAVGVAVAATLGALFCLGVATSY